ncbi:MAG: sigma-E processing peptidase SpoIIGA [Clostridia bacterium]|nr:sigma-E processing peptidase SpoIIGA [Clostridia bacterium]
MSVYIITMQVYVELALAENFCMDFTLLSSAKLITKNICSYRRVACASALGACFAVVFPLFGLSGAWAVAVKLLSGFALAAFGCRIKSVKNYLKFSFVFLGLSLFTGGALIAVFSLAGWDYASGGGYIISSVPIGIPLFAVFLLALGCKVMAKKFSARANKNSCRCIIYKGDKSVSINGFVDSGNKVYSGGVPVSVIPPSAAQKLTDAQALSASVTINTVTGSQKIKIFTADKIEIYLGQEQHTIKSVKIGISPREIEGAVLHPDLL